VVWVAVVGQVAEATQVVVEVEAAVEWEEWVARLVR